ncbi:MAG: translation initiation factor IF-2 [Planctomycetes bacterium]|nr:translation initiation factor IF-2 [Planctomycetota bacterium]
MSKTLRVHNLAKELGIDSKEIVAKCHAEGIDAIKNHMAVVSLGLAESIREWFSAGADITSVESAAPVDLGKVKKHRARRKTSKDDETEGEGAASSEEVSAEAPPPETDEVPAPAQEIQPAAEPTPEPISPPEVVETPEPVVSPASPPAPAEEAPAPAVAAPVVVPAPAPAPPPPAIAAKVAAPIRISPPPAPPVIAPAGPQVVPAPATLKGPRVVRIEAPDPVRPPRPRPAPAAGAPTVFSPDRPAARGRGFGRGPTEGESESAKKTARSPRRHGRDSDIVVDERMREWKDQDVLERKERLAAATGGGLRARRSAERRRQTGHAPAAPAGRKGGIEITVPIMVKDFCAATGSTYKTISQKLLQQSGKLIKITDSLDAESAEMLALELNIALSFVTAKTELEKLEEEVATRERQNDQRRPPVVCILGHVDHGKTSLLDAIRKTAVAAGEAGGITQHIGAYRVDKGDWHVTFLDTPGHEAFTAMRARGAHMTDVVVLVIAATDGVMPQTIEAINHAKAAGVTIVVALNQIDVPNVDINKIYGQLAEQELVPSEWGGTVDVIKTSAISGQGIEELIGHLSTLSDLLDLKADPGIPAWGNVIEAQIREGRGNVAQILVREGTLKTGQFVACGPATGRIRALIDDKGKRIDKAGPSTPVEILGLDELPTAGDKLYVVSDLSRAKSIADEIKQQRRQESLQTVRKATLEDLLSGGKDEEVPELNIILKADVTGSLERTRFTVNWPSR